MSFGMKLLGFNGLINGFEGLKAEVGDDNTVYFVGTNVEYSVYVELGTSRMEAQPYIRPAVQEFNRLGPSGYISKHQPGALGGLSSTEDLVKASALALEKDIAERAAVDTGNLQGSIRAEEG